MFTISSWKVGMSTLIRQVEQIYVIFRTVYRYTMALA